MAETIVVKGLQKTLGFLTRPPRHPLRQLLLWYTAIGVVGTVLAMYLPVVNHAISSGLLMETAPTPEDLLGLFNLPDWLPAESVANNLSMAIVMVGALLLSIPVSWGYMAIRECDGFDQSVVQTIVILPVVVAAIMMIVQHSLALAFALAGVSAAVRFRNTLKDVSDATYVFLALGIGISAGVGQLGSAAVMSFIFIFVSVAMWRCNWGCPEAAEASKGKGAAAAEPAAPVRKGMLSVHLNDSSAELQNIESILDIFAKTWVLERMEPGDEGGSILRYKVRLRKAVGPDVLVHELLFHGEDLVTDAVFEAI